MLTRARRTGSVEEEAAAAIHTLRVVRRRAESRERALPGPDAARPEESAVAHAAEEGKGKGEGEGEGEGELTPTWRSKSQYVGVFKSSANRSSKTPCTRLRIQHPLSHYYYYE